jgi:hypothetical protein
MITVLDIEPAPHILSQVISIGGKQKLTGAFNFGYMPALVLLSLLEK